MGIAGEEHFADTFRLSNPGSYSAYLNTASLKKRISPGDGDS